MFDNIKFKDLLYLFAGQYIKLKTGFWLIY